ncbi:O-methyltransferase [Poronia punctata]|nr:O-methyltransferase [Poronia punctata]
MATQTTRILQLSSLIAQNTELINAYLDQNGLSTPSFDAEASRLFPFPIPTDSSSSSHINTARTEVIEACSELKDLLTGPRDLVRFQWTAHVSVKAILRFKLDQSFAVGESTSFEAMSAFSGLDVKTVRRIVRHAIINHRFFKEDVPGTITHSALTAVLANDEMARNSLVVELDEFWPAGVKMADAMEKWPNSEENNQTGFSLANNNSNGNKGMFDIFAENPERGERFGRYFSNPNPNEPMPADGIVDSYDWDEKRTMVDVGGSHGSVAISIAERFPHMTCFVQDLPDTVAEGASRLPAHLQGRVKFMAHDFFTPQTQVADVYYFKSIFHNWADKYCIEILRNLIPSLRPGARIIIHERILPGLENLTTADAKRAICLTRNSERWKNDPSYSERQTPTFAIWELGVPRVRFVGLSRRNGRCRRLMNDI